MGNQLVPDDRQDGVMSIFMFHELPPNFREFARAEARRAPRSLKRKPAKPQFRAASPVKSRWTKVME